jgi:hypothetical protein
MNAYVLGAGVSKSVEYPVGPELFDEIDKYVRESGNCWDRFDYRKDWDALHQWLRDNSNPTIVQAYTTKNIEHLFTILDFAFQLRGDALSGAFFARCGSDERTARFDASDAFDKKTEDYQRYRSILLWALEHYFAWRHDEDHGWKGKKKWDTLSALADRMQPGDVIITFNYDATIERVLLEQKKWSLSDGYGFELVFQQSRQDKTIVPPSKSPVIVLHLHGATGWYPRPTLAPDYSLPPEGAGALPSDAFGAAPMGTNISLDPKFLTALGVYNVDACLPDTFPVNNERHVVLHPSYLKVYETAESGTPALIQLWQRASQVLREAEHTFIIGYSLPRADAAALTLLLTTPRRGDMTVVNPDGRVVMRLGRLFYGNVFAKPLRLEQWLDGSDAL